MAKLEVVSKAAELKNCCQKLPTYKKEEKERNERKEGGTENITTLSRISNSNKFHLEGWKNGTIFIRVDLWTDSVTWCS